MSRLRARGALVLLVVGALVTACSSGGSDGAAPRKRTSSTSTSTTTRPAGTPTLSAWHSCEQGECASLDVPLDPERPDGRQITLAVARASRAKPDRRIGSLLLNPGGPGASGLDIVEYAAAQLPAGITDRFDIVSWDPRGAGKSSPVSCGEDLDARFAVDDSPDDPAELQALEAAAKHVVAECVADSGADLLRHVSTADTVRDLDALRAALGDRLLTYMGFSYGTYIGARYAAAYPDHVRALVLDGAIDPARPIDEVAIQQAQGFEQSLDGFFTWCTRNDCAFHGRGDPAAAYDALARSVDARPRRTGGRTFGPTQLDVATAALLYSGAQGYRTLGEGLADLEAGRPGSLLQVFDIYVGRSGGTYDAEWPAFIAIGCADGPNLDQAQMEDLQRRAAVAAPRFGAGTVGLGYECAYWPYPPERTTTAPIEAATPRPVVVVGTTGDPATPFNWAEGLASELGNARLVQVDDVTHTAGLNGNPCLDRILTRYLVDLVPPDPGARCS